MMKKSKLKDIKKTELIMEIQLETKTFNQLVIEVKGKIEAELKESVAAIKEHTAEEYIPRLCNALKKENPELTITQIKVKVEKTVCPDIWRANTVRTYWPQWMKDPHRVDIGILGDQNRIPKNLGKKTLLETDSDNPALSWTPEEYEETHPTKETTPFQSLGEINRAIARLWETLTGEKNMPTSEDDVKKDHLMPTRDRFSDVMNGSSKVERDFLFNWMTWLEMLIKDRIALIEKADKTAYDR